LIVTDIVVQRPNAFPYKAEDIFDILIQGKECALARGRSFLDEKGTGTQVVSFDIPYVPNLRLGQIVQVSDSFLALTWRAKIVSISHKIQIGSGSSLLLTTNLKVKKPSTYFVPASEF
jgi:hypothetical protein